MSPLSGFLALIVFFTAILIAYLTKQFENENLNYLTLYPMKNSNTKIKTIEKEKEHKCSEIMKEKILKGDITFIRYVIKSSQRKTIAR